MDEIKIINPPVHSPERICKWFYRDSWYKSRQTTYPHSPTVLAAAKERISRRDKHNKNICYSEDLTAEEFARKAGIVLSNESAYAHSDFHGGGSMSSIHQRTTHTNRSAVSNAQSMPTPNWVNDLWYIDIQDESISTKSLPDRASHSYLSAETVEKKHRRKSMPIQVGRFTITTGEEIAFENERSINSERVVEWKRKTTKPEGS